MSKKTVVWFICLMTYFNSYCQEAEVFQADTVGLSRLQDYVIESSTKVIRNERQYDQIIEVINEKARISNAHEFTKRNIDFSRYDLVGYRMQYGCCRKQDIANEVSITEKGKTTCLLNITPRAACRGICRYTYWFIIPKLKSRFHLSIKTN